MTHPHAPPPADAERGASRTALGVALMRAAHLRLDAAPPILDDAIAERLFTPETRARLDDPSDRLNGPGGRHLRSHVVVRARWTEDRLADAAARGVAQYVVLGAGLDTFAYRQPAWAAAMRLFEADHPASQRDKRARLAAAGIAEPANLGFVPVDFERDDLAEALVAHGVRRDRPTAFAWLGVMMYLERAAVDTVLRAVASWPAGSELYFTFAPPPPPGVDPRDWPSPRHRAATAGEPWRTFFTPEALAGVLRGAGFAAVEFLEPAVARARYFAARDDQLPAPTDVTIGAARV